ncbi:MAG: adenosine deaminase, partial [Bdellovibrio sp.]|nr:adenosine deaminase [Bdellovibrio sp.]
LMAQKVLASEQILERLAFEVCEDAFNDGVRVLELRYAPTFIASGHNKLTFEKIHHALVRGIEKAKKQMPIAVGLICILQRVLDLKTVDAVTSFAIENKDTFLALDLADNEDGFEPKPFAPYFMKAKAAGLRITVHSGESPDPRAGQFILDSINILGAERIGHGVQSILYSEVIKTLIKNDILLEVCPYSNYLTQAFTTYENHPLKKLIDAQVSVAICSDDPGMFASTLSDDYLIAQTYQKLTLDDFKKCNEAAYKHSFISESEKKKAWN